MSDLRVVNVAPAREADTPLFRGLTEYDELDLPSATFEPTHATFSTPSRTDHMSPMASPSPPSIFDIAEETQDEGLTEGNTGFESSGQESEEQEREQDSYNLKPPPLPPTTSHGRGVEAMASRLFSMEHLNLILRDPSLAMRFARFLNEYRPQHSRTLKQYSEAQKAMAAVRYANTVARSLMVQPPYTAVILDDRFDAHVKRTVDELVQESLPAYLTHRLVGLVTDTLVKEITGNNVPMVQGLIPSLAEVYCITDPSVADSPIVYASEEFYNTTQYGKDYVIGRNCRFLQGPRSSQQTVRRLVQALANGEECMETILNYKRDGTPFLNLLMIAPLYDNKGAVRYFLGCQIDVTSLIEEGRGLESFAQLLADDRCADISGLEQEPRQALRELGQLLDEDEAEMVKKENRRATLAPQHPASIQASVAAPHRTLRSRSSRVILAMDDTSIQHQSGYSHANLEPPARLPGVYRNYLLVRPYPSLRVTFTSPTLRIPGMLQTKLMDRIGGPPRIRDGLQDALSKGVGVTAKVSWRTSLSELDAGKPRWLHCTPLLGSDDKVGVWMIVIVENEQVTGTLNRQISNRRLSGLSYISAANQYTANKLYADYLKRQDTQQSSFSREQREAYEPFRDF